MSAVAPLHRHQLVRLTAAGWQGIVDGAWDADARACLGLWAARGLPLVVTRQPAPPCATVSLGLPAPSPWRGRRLALGVAPDALAACDEFPSLDDTRLDPHAAAAAWARLRDALRPLPVTPRVYGSHGWQALTGLPHAHDRSDIDLWVAVDDAPQADAVAAALDDAGRLPGPRLDGELVFPGDRAVAWREWLAWRAGRTRAILCRTLTGAARVDTPAAEGLPC
mgnify:CR=1 FL=1